MRGTVAVTGATGFLGRYIVRSLIAQGWRVRILARNYPVHDQFADLNFEVVAGDLSDPAALRALVRDADRVVHGAGLIMARNACDFQTVNVQGTANLVDALNGAGGPARLLVISSITARAPHLSPYAASKRAAEDIVRTRLAPLHEWIILRPTAVYGPWDVETLAVWKAVSRGIALLPGSRTALVSLVHAADVADAVAALCAAGQAGSLYEITDARQQGYLWEEFTEAAAHALGVRTAGLRLAPWIVRLAGLMGTLLARAGAADGMLTIDKAQEILHPDWSSRPEQQPPPELWQPKIDLDCGFRETIGWYQTRGWLPNAGKRAGLD